MLRGCPHRADGQLRAVGAEQQAADELDGLALAGAGPVDRVEAELRRHRRERERRGRPDPEDEARVVVVPLAACPGPPAGNVRDTEVAGVAWQRDQIRAVVDRGRAGADRRAGARPGQQPGQPEPLGQHGRRRRGVVQVKGLRRVGESSVILMAPPVLSRLEDLMKVQGVSSNDRSLADGYKGPADGLGRPVRPVVDGVQRHHHGRHCPVQRHEHTVVLEQPEVLVRHLFEPGGSVRCY